jgi:hypothetical protein
MPIDIPPGSLAAVTITALFWWTVLSPVGLLVVAALCSRHPRLRGALTLVILTPPLVTVLPVAVMSDGPARLAAAGAAVLLGAAVALEVLSLARGRRGPERADRQATSAFLLGVAGGMLGSGALVGTLLFA